MVIFGGYFILLSANQITPLDGAANFTHFLLDLANAKSAMHASADQFSIGGGARSEWL